MGLTYQEIAARDIKKGRTTAAVLFVRKNMEFQAFASAGPKGMPWSEFDATCARLARESNELRELADRR